MKSLEEMVAVMQACLDGKEIEFRNKSESEWVFCDNIHWDWNHFDYRVKSEPKTRLMTFRELAQWCAEGKGEFRINEGCCQNTFYYNSWEEDMEVTDDILIRGWDETEWHKPLVEMKEEVEEQ